MTNRAKATGRPPAAKNTPTSPLAYLSVPVLAQILKAVAGPAEDWIGRAEDGKIVEI